MLSVRLSAIAANLHALSPLTLSPKRVQGPQFGFRVLGPVRLTLEFSPLAVDSSHACRPEEGLESLCSSLGFRVQGFRGLGV